MGIGQYINNLLPQNFRNYSLEEQTLKGPVKKLKIRLRELLYVLERMNPSIFQQAIEHIIAIEESLVAEKKRTPEVKKIKGNL